MASCTVCGKVFTTKRNLIRHNKLHDGIKFSCSICTKVFSRKEHLINHTKKMHCTITTENQQNNDTDITTNVCSHPTSVHNKGSENIQDNDNNDHGMLVDENYDFYVNEEVYDSHKRENENSTCAKKLKKARMELVKTSGFVEIASSHHRKIVWFYAKNIMNLRSYQSFLNSMKNDLIDTLRKHTSVRPIKFNLKLEASYNQPHVENSSENRAFKTSARSIFLDSDIEDIVDESFNVLYREEDTYQSKGSGFSLQKIDGLLLAVYRYIPMGGSSYIKLPTFIEKKRAVINPQNDDQQCFKWAILAKHVEGLHKERIGENYDTHEAKYNFSGITFPTPLHEVKIFEKNNPSTSINVYSLQKKNKEKNQQKNIKPEQKYDQVQYTVIPLKVVKDEKEDHFDLLLIKKNENAHFTFISNLSRLVRAQLTKHRGKICICKRCFTFFDNHPKKFKLCGQAALYQHMKICGENKPILPVMPKEGATLGFEAWYKTQHHPVVIYADFEALLVKCEDIKGANTMAFQQHKPMSYGIYVKAADDIPTDLLEKFNIPSSMIVHRGSKTRQDVAKHFIQTVIEITRNIEKLFETNVKIDISKEEEQIHLSTKKCNLCKNEFTSTSDKVKDHYHLTGRFRQTLCASCNLKLQRPNFVPCFFHNLSNYDSHFIVTELGYDKKSISVIPNSEEKFISFSKYVSPKFTIRFVDTIRFMASSLSTLASNLITSNFDKFRETAKQFNINDMRLVTRKGVYPYEYTDRWEVLDETTLPSRENFYSSLTEDNITDDEYVHAADVWEHFGCQTLGEYSDLYLKIDVLLLADVFENFRDVCISTHALDPAFYYTAPGLSFDAMLRYTRVQLELLSDYDMLLMFEKGIRGGLTQASMRHAKANNFKSPDYDESKPPSWIIYQDCNNLYGWAMSEYMPYGGFKWIEPTLDGLNTLTNTSEIGRVYEVDIEYPQHLHDQHNDLPLLPSNSIPPSSKVQKLIATLENKDHYIVHYRNLQQAIAYGLEVKKVHRVLEFKQSAWLAKYINLNTELRKKATNDFEKDYFKLLNNSVFGKTMESMRKRMKMELVSCPIRLQKLINNPMFKHCTSYNENLAAVSMENKVIDFCKPIYIGFAVLDISKTLMYDYHYSVMKKHYNDSINLMYTDTDSLVYHIQTADFYADMKNNSILLNRMDTSNLPRDHPCFISERKKVPGLFSDETNGETVTEFVALRAKSYAFTINGKEKIKAKGIRGHVVKHSMTLEEHVKCLYNDPNLDRFRENISFRSFNHNVVTIRSNKLTYNNHDDKRMVLDDGVHTMAHGHFKIGSLN